MLSTPRPESARPVAPAGLPITAPVAAIVARPNPVSVASAGIPQALEPYRSSPIRKLAFYFGLAFIFVKFGVVSELLGQVFGSSGYILYLVAPPAIIGAIVTGGLRRTFRTRAPYFWMAFFGWMVLAVPFSYWQGGSFTLVSNYSRFNLILMLASGGLATNWKEIRLIFYTIAAGTLLNLLTARLFMDDINGRISLDFGGSIGNSNDLAAHLLFVLPFVLWVVLDHKRSMLIRIPLLGAIGYGLWVIVGTASRGALIAVFAGVLFLFWRASMRQRFAGFLACVILAVVLVAASPKATLDRLGSLFGEQNEEADASADIRGLLFRKSLAYTVQHPIFGVGPDQFSNYESQAHDTQAKSLWHPTHCAWTQVSSECGIPALIFYVCGLGSAALLINRTYRTARQKGYPEVANVCLCYLLAMLGFHVAISFLSNAYTIYGPFMVGLAGSISFAAAQQMAAKKDAAGFGSANMALVAT